MQFAHILETFIGTFSAIMVAYIIIKPLLDKDRAYFRTLDGKKNS